MADFLAGFQTGMNAVAEAQQLRTNALNMTQRIMAMDQQKQMFPLEVQQLSNRNQIESLNIQSANQAMQAQHEDDLAWADWHTKHTNAIDLLTSPPTAGTIEGMKRIAEAQKIVGDTVAGMELVAQQQAKNPLIQARLEAEKARIEAEKARTAMYERPRPGTTGPQVYEVPDPRNPNQKLLMSPRGAVIDSTKFMSIEQRDELKQINSLITVYQKQVADQEAIGSVAAKQKVKDLSAKIEALKKQRQPIYDSAYQMAKASAGEEEASPSESPKLTSPPIASAAQAEMKGSTQQTVAPSESPRIANPPDAKDPGDILRFLK